MLQKFTQLFKDSFTYSIGGVLSKLIGFFLIPVYTRVFIPEDMATIELLFTFNGFLAAFLSPGMDSAQTRYFFESDDIEYKRKVVSSNLFFYLVWGTGIIGVCLLSTSLFNQLLFDGTIPNHYFFLTFISALFSVVLACLTNVYRLLLRPKPYLALTLSQSILSMITIIILVVYMHKGITGYLLGYTASILICILPAVLLLKNYITYKISFNLIKVMLKFGIPLMPTGLAIWVMNFADRYCLTQYASMNELGIYSVAAKFALAIGLITGSFRTAWTPLSLSISKQPDAKEFYRNVADLYIVILSFAIIIMTGISKLIMILMTQPVYYEGYPVIGILAYGSVFYGFYTISSLGVWLSKKTLFATIGIFMSAIINVLLNIILIPLWGIIGAASATLIAYIVGNVVVLYFSEKHYPIKFRSYRLLFTIVVTCIVISVELVLLRLDWPVLIQYCMIVLLWIITILLFAYVVIGKNRISTIRKTVFQRLVQMKGSE